MSDKDLGARLAEIRSKLEISQKAVCDAIGIPKVQTLSSYERGINSPPLDTLKKLASYYGTSTDYLLFGREHTSHIIYNDKYYLAKLIEAADMLQCSIEASEDGTHHIVLDCRPRPANLDVDCRFDCVDDSGYEVHRFMVHWMRLRQALSSGAIDQDDYETIIAKRLAEIPENVHLAPVSSQLPF